MLARFVLEAATGLGVPPQDTAWFVDRLLTLLTSCDERRLGQWELQSWWAYVGRRPPLAGVPQVPRRRAHAHAGGGPGARDERAHRRLDPAAAAVRPHARRRPRRPRARRPDQRRLDRPVGRAPRGARASSSAARRRSRASRSAGGRVASATAGGETVDRRPLRRRGARSRSCGCSPGRTLRAAEPRLNGLDTLVTRWMNGVMFYLARTSRWSTATPSTSTPSGR